MKNTFFLFGILLFVASCGNTQKEQIAPQNVTKDTSVVAIPPDPQVAINFLNEYIKHSGNKTEEWLKHCGWVTDNYVTRYIAAAKKQQKDLKQGGEPVDLVTGNMDWCETGYRFRKFDAPTGYVLAGGSSEVSGCDENTDPVIVKIVQIGDKWLVDGSGAINIPDGAYEIFH